MKKKLLTLFLITIFSAAAFLGGAYYNSTKTNSEINVGTETVIYLTSDFLEVQLSNINFINENEDLTTLRASEAVTSFFNPYTGFDNNVLYLALLADMLEDFAIGAYYNDEHLELNSFGPYTYEDFDQVFLVDFLQNNDSLLDTWSTIFQEIIESEQAEDSTTARFSNKAVYYAVAETLEVLTTFAAADGDFELFAAEYINFFFGAPYLRNYFDIYGRGSRFTTLSYSYYYAGYFHV